MQKTESFEQYSVAYDGWFEKTQALDAAALEVVRKLLTQPETERVEVGVGFGRYAAPLRVGSEVSVSSPAQQIQATFLIHKNNV
ncbi:MAG: hypothetical protein RBR06_04635 [Desulfuromonadaceae bacterium]|nr:hypothetical protein [Desulfuromonadaceae bacterium]